MALHPDIVTQFYNGNRKMVRAERDQILQLRITIELSAGKHCLFTLLWNSANRCCDLFVSLHLCKSFWLVQDSKDSTKQQQRSGSF